MEPRIEDAPAAEPDAERKAEPDAQRRRPAFGYGTNRLEAFSDGVFAIAITLLVLEIGVPLDSEGDLFAAVLAQWPSYLAYVVSFATIGAVWLGHVAITDGLERADGTFIRLNLLLLFVVAFLPFPTRLLAEHLSATDAERVAVTFYGLNLLLTGILTALLWRYAARYDLLRRDMQVDEVRILSQRLTPGLGGYVVLLALGLIRPTIAVVGYLLIAIFFLIPFARPGHDRGTDGERRGLRRFD